MQGRIRARFKVLRGKISEVDLWTAGAATAGAIPLLFAATQSQAQTFRMLHTFTGAVWEITL